MKARELRIGNIVSTPNQPTFRIDLFDYVAKGIGKFGQISDANTHPLTWYLQDLKPIPLTEEWLLKFGFELIKFVAPNQQCGIDLFYGYDYAIKKIGNKTDLIIRYKHDKFKLDSFYSTDFKYVHTLQNLYFVLTSEELLTK